MSDERAGEQSSPREVVERAWALAGATGAAEGLRLIEPALGAIVASLARHADGAPSVLDVTTTLTALGRAALEASDGYSRSLTLTAAANALSPEMTASGVRRRAVGLLRELEATEVQLLRRSANGASAPSADEFSLLDEHERALVSRGLLRGGLAGGPTAMGEIFLDLVRETESSSALQEESAPAPEMRSRGRRDTVRFGNTGGLVRELTELLSSEDVGLLDGPTDVFDDEVEEAVRAWQHHGVDPRGRPLKVDGVAGAMTLASLRGHTANTFLMVPDDLDAIAGAPHDYAEGVVRRAIGEMRAGAKEIGGNNKGKWVTKYHRGKEPEGRGWAWCAAFTSWCFSKAAEDMGVEMPFEYTGGAQNIIRQFARRGWVVPVSHEAPPLPGDVVVWWRGQTRTWKGHVGIVWGYRGRTCYVIEGNVGKFPAKVRMFSYDLDSMPKLIGFGRVPAR